MSGMRTAISALAKRRVIGAALWLGWALLLAAAMQNANRLAAVYPAVSLRYNTSISNTAATAARRYAAEYTETSAFWPTFWAQQENVETAGLHKAAARCLWFSGDAALVWPAGFEQGGYPGPLDDTGCCVSDTLAWRLWGGVDVTGHAITVGGQNYTVRGVFRSGEALIMAGVGERPFEGGWQAVELAGYAGENARGAALAFAQGAGLGRPATLIDGAAVSAAAGFFAAAPAAVVGLALLIGLCRRLAGVLPAGGRWAMALGGLLIGALALPGLLETLPPAFIPNRFSDFAFWGRLITEQWEYIKEWLLLRPYSIDLSAKLLLAAQAVIWVVHSIISAVLIKQMRKIYSE